MVLLLVSFEVFHAVEARWQLGLESSGGSTRTLRQLDLAPSLYHPRAFSCGFPKCSLLQGSEFAFISAQGSPKQTFPEEEKLPILLSLIHGTGPKSLPQQHTLDWLLQVIGQATGNEKGATQGINSKVWSIGVHL